MVSKAQEDAEKTAVSRKVDIHGKVLLGMSVAQIEELLEELGEEKYRAKHVYDGVMKGARSIEAVSWLPKPLREKLVAAGVRTGRSTLHHSVAAPDGTRKFLLQLVDGRVVEAVGIPADNTTSPRLTVCVSSQVGCPMRCTFCATGKGGFARNLVAHEIVDQVLTVQEEFKRRVSNVVFMGMGEPLLNLANVLRAYNFMNLDMGIGARNITISTVGVPQSIERLARSNVRSTLAVSIHAPSQELRETLIPSARAYPIDALMSDCVKYFKLTGRRVTYEYTLLAGINDSDACAAELASLLKHHDLASHVNLIAWNPVDDSEFKAPSRNRVYAFKKVLEAQNVEASIRMARGLEAAAACGQLRNRYQKEPLPQYSVPS